jgi:hypothetical protein
VEPDFDSKFKAVRAFATIANVFGFFAWFTFAMASCCPLSQERLKGMSIYFFLASFFQGMTLLLFKSDVCKMYVINTMLYLKRSSNIYAYCEVCTQHISRCIDFFFYPRGFFQDYFIGTDVDENIDEVVADVECSLDRGARLAIVACVFYFLSMNQIPTVIAPMPIGYRRAAMDADAEEAQAEGSNNVEEGGTGTQQ